MYAEASQASQSLCISQADQSRESLRRQGIAAPAQWRNRYCLHQRDGIPNKPSGRYRMIIS